MSLPLLGRFMNMSLLFLTLPLAISANANTVNTLPNQPAPILSGQVKATDGDSLRMGNARIRLYGVDAVETAQRCDLNGESWKCGRASRKKLERLTKGKTIECEVKDMDRTRFVSVCTADGVDLGAEMVRSGWAVAYTQYSMNYVADEAAAKAERRGLWRSNFARPHDWRASRRAQVWQAAERQVPPSTDCLVKGNISRDGTKIFHSPGQADYARTRVSVSSGERWFCSKSEAIEAGWRAAKR